MRPPSAPRAPAVRSTNLFASSAREPEGLADATVLLASAVEPLRPEGKPLFAGLLSLGLPGEPMGDMWRLADMLREYRGDAHTAAWTSAGLHATEVGLLTELYWGLPMRSYIRTRAWTDEQLTAAETSLSERGLVVDGAFTAEGRALRESVEEATDAQCAVILDALGDSVDRAAGHPRPVGRCHPRRRRVPAAGTARSGARSLTFSRAVGLLGRPRRAPCGSVQRATTPRCAAAGSPSGRAPRARRAARCPGPTPRAGGRARAST